MFLLALGLQSSNTPFLDATFTDNQHSIAKAPQPGNRDVARRKEEEGLCTGSCRRGGWKPNIEGSCCQVAPC